MNDINENVVDIVVGIIQAQGRDPAEVSLEEAKQLTLTVLRNRKRMSTDMLLTGTRYAKSEPGSCVVPLARPEINVDALTPGQLVHRIV